MKSNLVVFASVCAVTLVSIGCSSSTKDSTPVGTVPAGAFTFEISQEGAAVAPGATSRFVLKPTGAKPASVTGWIGVASGEGSTKKDAVYDANDGDFDDDVVAPSPLPAGAMFWFTVTDGAASTTASIAWKK